MLVEGTTKTIPDTIIQTSSNTIIKPAMLDSFGRLKFVLGDTSEYVLMDTGNPIGHISLKSTADRINIKRYPKHSDGFTIPVNFPGVGYIPTLKAFVEDRGANLISPMLFTRFYDVEFSKEAVVFDPNKIRPPTTIPYVHSPNQLNVTKFTIKQ